MSYDGPFPWSMVPSSTGTQPTRVHEIVAGVALDLKTDPKALLIRVKGGVNSTGWRCAELQPMSPQVDSEGYLNIEMLATPPTGMILWYFTKHIDDFVWFGDVDKLSGVKIHSRMPDPAVLPVTESPVGSSEELNLDSLSITPSQNRAI